MTVQPRSRSWTSDALRLPRPTWLGLVFCAVLGTCASLVAEDRDQWQQPDRVMHDLGLKPGTRVADMGCGRGYFTLRIARAVGPKGKVLAVDIDRDAIKALGQQAAQAQLANVETIVPDGKSAALPDQSVDVVLLCLVLHEAPPAQRLPLVQSAAKALKPGGVLFIIDWRKSRDVKFDPYEKLIPRDDLLKWCTAQGLTLDAEFHYLKYEVFLRFRKPS